jgi:tetratricopeptide (TPR) repeat protein
MNRIFLLIALASFSVCLHAQKNKKKKELKGEDAKAVLDQVFSDSTVFLRNAGQQACNCMDSVHKVEKDADKIKAAFSNCIDEQAGAYQLAEKLMASMRGKSDNKIELSTDKNSTEYKNYYYAIERWVKDSCATLNLVINTNDVETDKSFSKNQDALSAYDEGLVFLRKEKYEDAITFFEKAVNIDKEFVFAWDNLGVCYRKTNQLDKAEAAYKASLAAEPRGKMAMQNLGVVYQYQKKYDEAIAAYKEILKYYPEDPEVYYGIGIIYHNGKDNMEEALQNMCKAYNIYVEQKSAFRSDAEKVISMIYNRMKKDNKEEVFSRILKENNIKVN